MYETTQSVRLIRKGKVDTIVSEDSIVPEKNPKKNTKDSSLFEELTGGW